MKKIIVFIAGLLLATTTVNAEQYDELPKEEVSVSIGFEPYHVLAEHFANAFATIITAPIVKAFGEDIEFQDRKSFGAINVDYNHHINPSLALGVNLGYSQITADVNGKVNGVKQKVGSEKEQYYTVMTNVKWDWHRRKHITLYSRASVGVMFENYKTTSSIDNSKCTTGNKVLFAAQVSPFGIELGSKNVRGFYEIGFGHAGIAQLGVRVKL